MIQLSICIPTYNFGKFIGQTLDSILCQLSDAVEIIVLDGGSTDETAIEVKKRQINCAQLCYVQQNFRGGIDRDIEKVVSLSKGRYCWLFSADDIMLPGAIEKILKAIVSGYDVYLCDHVLCNFHMETICDYPPFNDIRSPTLFDLGDESQRGRYFCLARTSEAFFSFMSGPIFKKATWDAAIVEESFRGSYWIVAGHLLNMIPRGVKVYYLGEKLLLKRGENDSFADRGIVNRFRIAIESFQNVGNTIFGGLSMEAFHIRRVLKHDIPLRYLMLAKLRVAQNPEIEDINVLNRIARLHYADPCFSNFVRYSLYKAAHPLVIEVLYHALKFWKKK